VIDCEYQLSTPVLFPQPAGDVGVRPARRTPPVERLEPRLPATPGGLHDLLVRDWRLEWWGEACRAIARGDQHPPAAV
jgi:hypothetical protein